MSLGAGCPSEGVVCTSETAGEGGALGPGHSHAVCQLAEQFLSSLVFLQHSCVTKINDIPERLTDVLHLTSQLLTQAATSTGSLASVAGELSAEPLGLHLQTSTTYYQCLVPVSV